MPTYLLLNLLAGNPYIPIGADSTVEAQTNVAMGAASWNYNPATLAQLTALAGAGLLPAAAIYPGSIDPAQPITPSVKLLLQQLVPLL